MSAAAADIDPSPSPFSAAPGVDPPIATIVLAAGSSTRMDRGNKMLLPLDGVTLLRRAVSAAVGANIGPVVVVLGHQRERAAAEIEGLACRAVYNPEHADGMHTSLRAGIEAVDEAAAAIVLLADMPFVGPDMLQALVARYREGGASLVVSRYGDTTYAPPVLYDRVLFDELRALEHGGGNRVVNRHLDAATIVSWPRERLADVDTEDEYRAVRARLKAPDGDAEVS